MIGRIGLVTAVQYTGYVPSTAVYKSLLIPSINTHALNIQAASLGLLRATGDTLASGTFLNAATATMPAARSRGFLDALDEATERADRGGGIDAQPALTAARKRGRRGAPRDS